MMASKWKLEQSIAQDTQALVISGFGRLEQGTSLFLQLPDACGGAWLKALLEGYPVTSADKLGGDKLPFTISAMFTASGLEKMGLEKEELTSFSAPFLEGMLQTDRARRLGDRRKSKWLDTVIAGGPKWSGNIEKTDNSDVILNKSATVETPIVTDVTVHAMVLLYSESEASVEKQVSTIKKLLAKHNVNIVHSLPLALGKDDKHGFSREHFGFADGISQPLPFDEKGAVIGEDGKSIEVGDQTNGVRLGEILIGHRNGHHEIAPGPIAKQKEGSPLPSHAGAEGFRDIGRNGSYVVVRQLRQNVPAFWKAMDKAADTIQAQDPTANHVNSQWMAEKVVGRGIDGKVLRPNGYLDADQNNKVRNDFVYFDDDRHGEGCPLGSHVRRSNPRDSLAPDSKMKQTLLDAANNHRILRRGRKYGPDLKDKRKDDGEERGLLFICLNTDIARQFEFTQQTWLLNSDFATLYEETDPLIGPDGEMTIPTQLLRRRAKVETFVQMVGGEYFFLPSISSLTHLASL